MSSVLKILWELPGLFPSFKDEEKEKRGDREKPRVVQPSTESLITPSDEVLQILPRPSHFHPLY